AILDDRLADVDAEAVDAAVEPETQDAVELVADVLAPPVEVGLVAGEVAQVVLAAAGLELPRGAPEHRHPVVGRRAVGARVGPDVPAGLRVVAARARLLEP